MLRGSIRLTWMYDGGGRADSRQARTFQVGAIFQELVTAPRGGRRRRSPRAPHGSRRRSNRGRGTGGALPGDPDLLIVANRSRVLAADAAVEALGDAAFKGRSRPRSAPRRESRPYGRHTERGKHAQLGRSVDDDHSPVTGCSHTLRARVPKTTNTTPTVQQQTRRVAADPATRSTQDRQSSAGRRATGPQRKAVASTRAYGAMKLHCHVWLWSGTEPIDRLASLTTRRR
jgi:hypothetical protein